MELLIRAQKILECLKIAQKDPKHSTNILQIIDEGAEVD